MDVTKPPHAVGLFLLVLGMRLVVISFCGVPVPYVDEWSAIGRDILIPAKNGTIGWHALFENHNGEHCILMTRLLELFLFRINQQWDPLVGMVLNAFLAATTSIVVFSGLSTHTELQTPEATGRLVMLCGWFWGLPFGYANLLWSFQSQMFLLLLFTTIAIKESVGSRGRDNPRAWLLVACLFLAILSSGGGLMTAFAAGLILLLRTLVGQLKVRQMLTAAGVVATAILVATMLKGPIPKGSTWGSLLAFLKTASWPGGNLILLAMGGATTSHYLPVTGGLSAIASHIAELMKTSSLLLPISLAVLGVLTWWPLLASLRSVFQKHPIVSPAELFAVGMSLWVLAVIAGISLKRPGDYFVPTRYIDLILPGLCGNAYLIRGKLRSNGDQWMHERLSLAWNIAIYGGMVATLAGVAFVQLPRKRGEGKAWMIHVADYVVHKDASRLENLGINDLPILGSDSKSLVSFLEIEGFSSLLVPEVQGRAPRHGLLGAASRCLLAGGPAIAIAGLLLLINARRMNNAV